MDQQERDTLARIDERTQFLVEALKQHFEDDREDFKEVHSRINRIAAKQNWMLGVGAAIVLVGGWAVGLKDKALDLFT